MKRTTLLQQQLQQLLEERPYLHDFFTALAIEIPLQPVNLGDFLVSQDPDKLADFALDPVSLREQCLDFILQMEKLQKQEQTSIRRITVKAGFDKSGQPEQQDLQLRAGEVVCVVGPTGSGKSRLLADIECLAQKDTPSGRQILIDGCVPDEQLRLSGEQQLIAQLSQNMNFVMDLSVKDFIEMHAESRMISDIQQRVEKIFSTAVELAGEPFTLETPVTALSGGQSRALMIADVACLSASPIVLIDEIENAGVDRLRALELLVKEEKIVLMATHDPLLALSGDRRLVIRNGGVVAVIETSAEERTGLSQLTRLDQKLARLRDQVRQGQRIVFDLQTFVE
jgi:ABC-type lipoprotein export system ATPase subunit